jgi:hypothetical protein
MATPLRPPRATGDPAVDSAGAIEYLWQFYKAIIEEQEFIRTSDADQFATPTQLANLGLDSAATLEGAGSTYTPVAADDVNLDALPTMFEAQYIRLGDVVTVSGRFTSNATTGSTTTGFTMTLPVASDFTALADCAGVAASPTSAGACAAIFADTTNNVAKVQWVSGSTAAQDHFFQFTYQIKE